MPFQPARLTNRIAQYPKLCVIGIGRLRRRSGSSDLGEGDGVQRGDGRKTAVFELAMGADTSGHLPDRLFHALAPSFFKVGTCTGQGHENHRGHQTTQR